MDIREEGGTDTGRESIKDKLDAVIELLEEKERKKKEFKLPFGQRFGAKRKIKKGYALVVVLKRNRTTMMNFLPIENGLVYLDKNKTYHLAAAECVFMYKKYPVIFLPEWSLIPIGYKEITGADNMDDVTQKVVATVSKLAQNDMIKRKGGFKMSWLLILVGLAVVGYIVFTQFVKK